MNLKQKYQREKERVKILENIIEESSREIFQKNQQIIDQEKLRMEKKIAERSAKFNENFLANMSHEIRTPMNGIIGMLEALVETTELNKVQAEYVKIVQRSSSDLLAILNDILDLSKLEAGRMKIQKEEIDFREVVHKVQGLFTARANQKGLYLESVFLDEFPEKIESDEVRLTQILSNLIGNAIKFTDEGGVTIKSTAYRSDEEEWLIRVEVIDTGIGIDAVNQKEIFSQFKQAKRSEKKTIAGSGLGLAICKRLIRLMKGKIGVNSELESGSNFWITFPTRVLTQVGARRHKNLLKIPKNMTALVVDDNEINLRIMKVILENLDWTVEFAMDGQEAVDCFEEGKFDVIFMDILMPVMDGVEATQTIKELYDRVPPIIGFSANAMEGDREKYISKGLDDYLYKPITLKDLKLKINDLFTRNGTRKTYHPLLLSE